MHILLIDDSSSTRSLLRTLINAGQAVRHEISEAASGEEALQKVESGEINLPELIILDINMGGINGYELCREFRQRFGKGSDINPYVIIVTANEGVEVINQALDAGANDYMPKPVNVKVLHVRLRVAERLLAQAHAAGTASDATPPPVDHSAALAEAVAQAVAETQAAAEISTRQATATAVADAMSAAEFDKKKAVAEAIADAEARLAASTGITPSENAGGPALDPMQALIAWGVEQTETPMALVQVADVVVPFQILYANAAMTLTTGFEREQLLDKSLSELEAWTDDFLKMANGYIEQNAGVAYVPLWSKTKQDYPVYLTFCPVPSGEEQVKHYIVIHHM
jgi:CheY-like chemotaxis protein